MYKETRYLLAGDKVLVIEFGNEISEAVNKKIRSMYLAILNAKILGIKELIPTYRSLMLQYDPLCLNLDVLVRTLKELEGNLDSLILPKPRIIEIPTIYGEEFGPDIEFVAEYNNLSVEEVIKVHTSTDYLIYVLGFTPGFPYLGGMSEKIETPRLKTPRTKIPAGSVGIAGKQTGIYPIESPGGWQLIGRTPINIYNPDREPPIILQAGDYIRFIEIGLDEYNKIWEQVKNNQYIFKVRRE